MQFRTGPVTDGIKHCWCMHSTMLCATVCFITSGFGETALAPSRQWPRWHVPNGNGVNDYIDNVQRTERWVGKPTFIPIWWGILQFSCMLFPTWQCLNFDCPPRPRYDCAACISRAVNWICYMHHTLIHFTHVDTLILFKLNKCQKHDCNSPLF